MGLKRRQETDPKRSSRPYLRSAFSENNSCDEQQQRFKCNRCGADNR
ncbi:unnamed protein product [Anisakis simplex]|uniref:RanBP2-type domain-containing protein n=1 Tax=Anisakis simplex TaxID=6269 RepID=A0A0M3K297_ANISI|nr:unnamed protein product [Anisakis simplex]